VEPPRLKTVTHLGNQKLTDESLKDLIELIGLKAGDTFSVETNRKAAKELLGVYHEEGHAFAVVKLEKGGLPDDREVVFRIDEGPRVFVTNVSFTGNTALPDWVLTLHAKSSTQTSWFSGRPFIHSDLDTDVAELKRIFSERGFFDVQVEHRETYSEDRTEVQIEFVIIEGTRYKVRHIEFRGNAAISADDLRGGMHVRTNEYYDLRLVQDDSENIENRYRRIGAIDPRAVARTRGVDDEPGVVDLVCTIREDFQQNANSDSDENQETCADVSQQIQQTQASQVQAEMQRVFPEPGDLFHKPGDSKSTAVARRKLLSQVASREAPKPPGQAFEPPGLRDVDRLAFFGVETFDEAEMRHTLAVDFDLIVTAHPDVSPFDFLKQIETSILSAYLHGGFPGAMVEVLYNRTCERVEVRVREGHRCRCGTVEVSGAGNLPAEHLIRALTEPTESSRKCWKIGSPVPFDDLTLCEMRAQLKTAFSDAGFFQPEFDLAVESDPDRRTARLMVMINDEGPCAAVRKIEIVGLSRDSVADVHAFLHVEKGTTCSRDLLDSIKRRLLDSGRYLHVKVAVESAVGSFADGRKPHDIAIELREYADAAPIAVETPPAERALMRLGEWIQRWARGETGEDIVVTATSVTDGAALAGNDQSNPVPGSRPAELQMSLRMVLRPQRGQTLTFAITGANGRKILDSLFVVGRGEVVFGSSLRKAKLVLPISDKERLRFTISGKEARFDEPDKDGKRFRLNAGLYWNARAAAYPNPFEVEPHFTAAFLTSLAHFDNPQCTVLDGICEISSDSLMLRFDQATGRLIERQVKMVDKTDSLTIRTERNAYEVERQNIDGVLTGCAPAYAPQSPWKSIVEFAMDEYLEAAGQTGLHARMQPYRALRKLIGAWDAPSLGELYRTLEYATNEADPFVIPSHLGGLATGDSTKTGSHWRKRTVARMILPIYRHLVPKRGWMWPNGRDALLSWASDAEVPVASFSAAPLSTKIGPLGELLLGLMDEYGDLNLVRKIASREGLQRLSTEALSHDYWPVLSDESWLGRWILSLAGALRELDESEIQALVLLLPDHYPLPREALANSLVLLANDREKPVGDVLPAVLDRFWEEGLRGTVKTALTKLAPARLLKPVPQRQADAVLPAGAEFEEAAEDDDVLVPMQQEPRSREPRRLKATATPAVEFPDGDLPDDEIPEILP
jgi:hypothetical protein